LEKTARNKRNEESRTEKPGEIIIGENKKRGVKGYPEGREIIELPVMKTKGEGGRRAVLTDLRVNASGTQANGTKPTL